MDKIDNDLGLSLSKIADCVRTASRPYAIGDPRGRAAVRARNAPLQQRAIGARTKAGMRRPLYPH